MRKLLCILLLCVTCLSRVYATHIFGGELLYTHDTGDTYHIALTLYGDCSGKSFSYLAGSTPIIFIKNGSLLTDSVTLLPEPGTGIEVSPVCSGELKNTSCHGGKLPGVTKYVYSANYTLRSKSANWQFIFAGAMGTSTAAGRSTAITNIDNFTTNTLVYLVATLNNKIAPNNSPQYTTIPTPFYCLNVMQQYNQGCSDADGDSLAYTLTPGLDNGVSVHYIYPYTYLEPLSADTFSFNKLNGQMTFLPNITQDALIVTKVNEYRNGVIVGSSMREMTFIILNNCNTTPPTATVTNVAGGYNRGNTITICEGTPDLSFNIFASDSVGDTIIASPNNVPATSTLIVGNNNTPNPVLSFSWNTSSLPVGLYNFYVTYKNEHCPISSSQTIAYTIIVVPPYTISHEVLYPTQCIHKALVQFNVYDGAIPRLLTLQQGGKTIKTYKDSSGVVRDSIAAGNYTLLVSSLNSTCVVSYSFSIVDSGKLPDPYTSPIAYCRYDSAMPLLLNFENGSTVQWYNAEYQPITAAPTPSTSLPGIYTWYVSEHYNVCDILFDTVKVTVNDLPHINILNQKSTVCLGDKIILEATGGIKYTWKSTSNKIVTDNSGTIFSLALDTVTYTVIATDKNNCTDSATSVYANIEPCCLFSYPNAFTPNGDGHNDRFRIVTYGNMESYELSIFNRWGQRVFISANPSLGWDGTYHDQPCEIGSYFYLLRAKCLTGHYEEQKGDITLIR